MPDDDPLPAALAEVRERNEGRIRFHAYTGYTVEHDAAEGDVRRLLAALDAALESHQRVPLYGCASTLAEPDACPHDPERDWDCHFESGDGEWLCEGRPEGAVGPATLALRGGMRISVVRAVLDGTARVDAAIAGQLDAALRTGASFWLDAQRQHDEDIARGATDASEEHGHD